MPLDSILILPDELISNILKCTDYKTVIACRKVGICPVVFSPAAFLIEVHTSSVVPSPERDSRHQLGAPVHRGTSSDRDVRWHTRQGCGPRRATEPIADGAGCMEELRVVDRR